MVSKSPNINRYFGGSLALGNGPLTRGAVDVNLPIQDRVAFRLNLLGHDSGVPGRDVVENDRWGFAPTLAFGLGTPTRLTLGYYKLKQDNISDYGIPWVPANNNILVEYRDKPAPVPRETFYGYRNRDREQMGADMATVRVEHDFSDSFKLRDQFRYGLTKRDSLATPPRFASPDSTTINREMRSWITEDDVWDNQADLTANFHTGSLGHAVVTGFSLTRENNLRRYRSAPNAPTTLLNPNPDDVYPGEITINPNVADFAGDTQAFYAFDTVSLGSRWQVNGGLRSERFDVDGINNNGERIARVDTMLSGRAGVVFKPTGNGSIYTSYGSSLNPSLEGLNYQPANDTLEPEKTYTVEFGSKWGLFRDRVLLSGALFQVNKTNARTPGVLPDDPPQILDGKQRVRGVELGVTGHVTPSWMVFGAYTFLDSKIVESNNPSELGNHFPQAPGHSYNLWTTYAFPWRVTLGAGVRYVGRRYSNTSNARFVDGYATGDLMASVPVTRYLNLRMNLINVTDEYYYERLGGGHVVPGPGRSLMVSTNFRF
jgi:catecholate siderophore receptor